MYKEQSTLTTIKRIDIYPIPDLNLIFILMLRVDCKTQFVLMYYYLCSIYSSFVSRQGELL